MFEPFNRGAHLRAVIAAALLSLLAFFAITPHAHAEILHHPHGHHHHRVHRAKLHRPGHRQRITIDVRTGAIEPARHDPFEMLGSLFRPPVAAAQSQVERGIIAAGQVPASVALAASRSAASVYAMAARMAPRWDVPVSLAVSEVVQESHGDCRARSPTDARGALQVEPYTALRDGYDPSRLFECEYGLQAGLAHLQKLIAEQGGISCHTISLYEGSERYVARHGGCTRYGQQVLARAHEIESGPLSPEIWEARWINHHHHRRHHRLEAGNAEPLAA